MMRQMWSAGDVSELRRFYPSYRRFEVSAAELCSMFGRTLDAVQIKASKLGLTEPAARTKPKRIPRLPKHATDEARRAAVGAATKRWQAEHGHPRGALGMKHTEAMKQKMGQMSRRMWELMTPEQRAELTTKSLQTKLARYGTGNPSMLGQNAYSRCRGGKRPDLENRYFRSGWEANYARYLNLQQAHGMIVAWEYEPETFVFHGITRGEITYTPDFRVTELDGRQTYREVKGLSLIHI